MPDPDPNVNPQAPSSPCSPHSARTNLLRQIPILGLFWRYPLILCFLAVSIFVSLNESAFVRFGALVYLPVLAFGSMMVAIVLRHLFYRHTADQDGNDGTFTRMWREELSCERRVTLSVVIVCVLFLGVCIIAAALAK